jgi:hypothetical protein
MNSEHDSVGSLYHEVAHAFIFLWTYQHAGSPRLNFIPERFARPGYKQHITNIMNKAKGYYTGARVSLGNKHFISDDPFQIATEACSEYVGTRVLGMWAALDHLHYVSHLDVTDAAVANNLRQLTVEAKDLYNATNEEQDIWVRRRQ